MKKGKGRGKRERETERERYRQRQTEILREKGSAGKVRSLWECCNILISLSNCFTFTIL
jgi:hypothetical protein